MKMTLRMTMIAATFVLLSATSVFAQSPKMRVHIPFAFAAGESHLPAGDYRISLDPIFHRFLLQQDGGSSIFLLAQRPFSRGAQDHGTLVFDKYGDRYFLRRVNTAGDSLGFEWPESRAEREMANISGPAELTFVRAALR